MITTFKEIVKNQGWKKGQIVETDIWMGANYIRHVTKAMLIEDCKVYLEYDQFIFVDKEPSVMNEHGICALDYSDTDEVVKANTKAEALENAKTMHSIKEEKRQRDIEKVRDGILKGINIIQKSMSLDHWTNRDAIKMLSDFQGDRFYTFRNVLDYAGFSQRNDDIDEDILWKIQRIYRQRGFSFLDDDNKGICTWVDLDHAISVETDCLYDDKDCIHIEMANGNSFNVYKESEHESTEDLYKALHFLYNY